MKFRVLSLLIVISVAAVLLAACDMMQNMERTCSVNGTVYINDRPMPRPEVMVYDPETGNAISIHNDEDQIVGRETGFYAIRRLPPGKYLIKVRTREGKLLTPPGEEPIVELKLGRITTRDIYINTK